MRPLLVVLLLSACVPEPVPMGMPDAAVDAGETVDAGVGLDAGTVDAGLTCGCTRWSNAIPRGTVNPPLDELSGLAFSRQQPVLFAHNDSGDTARFFAIDLTGALLETFNLTGAAARDWEDVTSGPCPQGTCLYFGDIGDNSFVRDDYAIFRVVEPHVSTGTSDIAYEKFDFSYPGGAHQNAEALLMNPKTGVLYVVTKPNSGPSEVYRFPLPLDSTRKVTLEKVTTLSIPTPSDARLTAGDANPCGTAVLLRMYNRLVELRLPEGETDFEKVFLQTPITVPVASEDQGEAVTYAPDGQSYFTSSETVATAPNLSWSVCR